MNPSKALGISFIKQKKITPVRWLTATTATQSRTTFEARLDAYLAHISHRTKCHVFAVGGCQWSRNIHSHLVLCVHDSEVSRFHHRAHRVDWHTALDGGWSNMHIEEYKPHLDGLGYALVKHEPWFSGHCPKQHRACRRGVCIHN